MITWLLLILAILAEVTATLSLKAALDQPALYVVVVAGYATTFTVLALVLRRGMGLGVAYGIWGAFGVTLTAILAAIIFGEELNAVMGFGIALVAAGVLLVEVGSQRARRRRTVEGHAVDQCAAEPAEPAEHYGADAGKDSTSLGAGAGGAA